MTLRIGSLFSGYCGLDIAIEDVFGARTAWVSDIDPGACKILAHRYPDVPNIGDITRIDWATVEPVDIISGGSPCQDLSHAGRRAGMTEGTRSNLWVAMREAIAVLKPTYVVWENVRGAMSADAASGLEYCPGCMGDPRDRGPVLRALGRVLGDLADLGYDAQWHGLRAADVGACHGRWRVFVLAYLADADRAGLQGQPHQAGATPAQRHGHALTGAGGPAVTLLPTPTSSDTNGAGAHGTGGADLRTTVALLPTPSTQSNEAPQSLDRYGINLGMAVMPGNYGPTFERYGVEPPCWADYAEAIARHERAFGRPAPDPTEPGAKGNPRLSARFVEWMMMLPAGHVTDVPGLSRSQQLHALGNGVVPLQGAVALRWLLRWMGWAA